MVFCKDCKFNHHVFFTHCYAEPNVKRIAKNPATGKTEAYLKDRSSAPFNQNYDCPYYKRKWWKFWVK